MDGVFMKKLLLICAFVCLLFVGSCFLTKQELQDNVIRLHVVANSDSTGDQARKLLVKDAVVDYLNHILLDAKTIEETQIILENNLLAIQAVANGVLMENGSAHTAEVSLAREAFDTRHYDTFSLPAGVYSSLRVCIGEAQGKNWWCVVFPSLCLPATTDGFADTAAGAGFDDAMTGSLTGDKRYKVRFFIMDCLGKLENLFFWW